MKGLLERYDLRAALEKNCSQMHSSILPHVYLLPLQKDIALPIPMLESSSWACAGATPVVSAEQKALKAWN